jgi:hypothetical protein
MRHLRVSLLYWVGYMFIYIIGGVFLLLALLCYLVTRYSRYPLALRVARLVLGADAVIDARVNVDARLTFNIIAGELALMSVFAFMPPGLTGPVADLVFLALALVPLIYYRQLYHQIHALHGTAEGLLLALPALSRRAEELDNLAATLDGISGQHTARYPSVDAALGVLRAKLQAELEV